MNNRIFGIVYLLITALIWGGAFIAQLLGGGKVGSFAYITYRCVFGCITIAIMIYIDTFIKTGKFAFFRSDENKRDSILNSFWCGFVLLLSMITQQIGVEKTDVAKAGLIASLEVICVPIIMLIFYKKKIRFVTWIFVITSMIGIMMLSMNSITGVNFGDFLVFLSTILYSISIIQVPIYIKTTDPLKFAFFRFLLIGFFTLILTLIFERDSLIFENHLAAWPSILYGGILASGVAYTLQIIGQKHCEPVIATLIMGLEGVFAAIFGWIILGQRLTFIQIIGCLIAVISTSAVEISDYYFSALEKNIK